MKEYNPFDLSTPIPPGYKLTNANTMTPHTDWREKFDWQFPTLNDSTPEGGYDAKIYVKKFIADLLTRQREAIIAELEKQKWGTAPRFGYQGIIMGIDEGTTDAHYKEHDKIMADAIEVIKNIHI